MTEHVPHDDHAADATHRHRPARRRNLILAATGLLALGGAAGAIAMEAGRSSVTMAPATPVAIRSLVAGGIVTVRGRVAEVYGNKFIMADATGRALIETGREGEGGRLVTIAEPVTVQGRFDRGFIHAAFLVGPDGKVTALGPLAGPPDHDPHGPRGGPGGPDAGPPPPPAGVPPAASGTGATAVSPILDRR